MILAIDYFSRFIIGKAINTKGAHKTLKFLKQVNNEISIETFIADNGKGFDNIQVLNWASINKITLRCSISYVHESNGQIERVNRAIRDALKRTGGVLTFKLKKVIDAYNNAIHRGTGLSPNDALKVEKKTKFLEHRKKYKEEFGTKTRELQFIPEQRVLIRNESERSRMDDEFKDMGKIKSIIKDGVYLAKIDDGKNLERHENLLRRFLQGGI